MLCASCGNQTTTGESLCSYHTISSPADDAAWAATNRVMCAWLCHGERPPRLAPADRFDESGPPVVES